MIGSHRRHAALVSTEHLDVTGTIALADSPPLADPKQPQGRPYAFEGIAFAPDGRSVGAPHALQRHPRHPVSEHRFPCGKRARLVARSEAANEGAAKAKFPGRKMLFDAHQRHR